MSNVSKKISNHDYHNNNDVIIQVKTKTAQPQTTSADKQKIDISSITTSSDLDTLSKVDPFLYHSIPSIYKSKLSCELVDHSQVIHEEHHVLQRKTRMSTECHSMLLLEDILLDDSNSDRAIASGDDVSMDDVMMFGDMLFFDEDKQW